MRRWLGLALALLAGHAFAAPHHPLVLKPNMDALECAMPSAAYRFLGSSAPGQLFLPGEAVTIRLALKKSEGPFSVEIQEITTRDPERRIQDDAGFTDTAGHAPLIGLEGKPIAHPIQVTFGDEAEAVVEVKGLPLPARFGTYALVLVRGGERQFLGSLARAPAPRPYGTLDNTPIFGEFGLLNPREMLAERVETYRRMGIRGMRFETSWSEREDGSYDWDRFDRTFEAVEKGGLQLMVTLGGHGGWMWPFKTTQIPAVVRANWDGSPYWGQCDWLCAPKLYPRYGKWITAFCQRYWKDGKGALWGIENYNEPWEGGGISGWARDCLEYRKLQKLIAESAWKVDRRIKICAASSIMNTEDKLYSDGSQEFDKYIDVFTDHYVVPPMSYGPMVAKAHGKVSVETETWFVNAEYLLPQGVAQFMATGQLRLSPWHQRVLFDSVPGVKDPYHIPTPVVAATAAFNHFVTGKRFEKIVFRNHLPWVFQFGKDDDPDALLIVFGKLMSISGKDPKERVWAQVEASEGGALTVENADGLLAFHDLAGNPAHVGQKSVTLPMSIAPTYITCRLGPAAAAKRLATARIEGKRPVEILPRDFDRPVAPGALLRVGVHNCLNRPIEGRLAVEAPRGITLKAGALPVRLAAGETKTVEFALAEATADPTNAYPFAFTFTSDAGKAAWREVMNAAIARKGTKTIDGKLDDWRDAPGITVVAAEQEAEATELLRRPWLDLAKATPDGNFARFWLAWDEGFLYVAARVNDPTVQADLPSFAERDEDDFFHSAKSDQREPYKTFLKKHPGRSFAEVPYVYARSPEAFIPFRRDRLHIALDVTDGWHGLEPTTDRVPYGFHAVPDTDYEYSLYPCAGGKSELWRHLAPGVPRMHDFPRQPRGERTTGAVPGARHAVRLDGTSYVYEMAIARAELADLKLQAGATFGLMLRAGNNKGPHVDYAVDKAVTKRNGLTLHPYWERSTNCGVRWTLTE
ncbi:hypothetical protein HQ560_01765 [bacterium]|nr:hypothetical protein [bacterium]